MAARTDDAGRRAQGRVRSRSGAQTAIDRPQATARRAAAAWSPRGGMEERMRTRLGRTDTWRPGCTPPPDPPPSPPLPPGGGSNVCDSVEAVPTTRSGWRRRRVAVALVIRGSRTTKVSDDGCSGGVERPTFPAASDRAAVSKPLPRGTRIVARSLLSPTALTAPTGARVEPVFTTEQTSADGPAIVWAARTPHSWRSRNVLVAEISGGLSARTDWRFPY